MNGYDKIKEQYLNLDDNRKDDAIRKIITFLMKQPNMNELFLKEEKNLNDMMKYIIKQAKEKEVNKVAMIDDAQVYEWATNYFSKNNDELGIDEQTTQIKSSIKTTKTTKGEDKHNNQLKLEL